MHPIVNLCAFNATLRVQALDAVTDARSELMTRLRTVCDGLKRVEIVGKGVLMAGLYFGNIEFAKDAVIAVWELRLQGVHSLTPVLASSLGFGDEAEIELSMNEGIRQAFMVHMVSLLESDDVKRCRKEAKDVWYNLLNVQAQLKKLQPFHKWQELQNVKQDLSLQHQLLLQRISEFTDAIACLEHFVRSRHFCEWSNEVMSDSLDSEDWQVLEIEKSCSWQQLHCLIQRECRRFVSALPLYSNRSAVLKSIQKNQVVLLIGETGSGKSTQLVQYLADAGRLKDRKCIVCTQPRKVAATALTQRVAIECAGCYHRPFSVKCFTSSVFKKQEPSDITYMTDYALLQFCVDDPDLSQFSCVVVDEAHERSLNTDLLLALLKACLSRRSDLKVVIMSASPDSELLSAFFDGCKICVVSGRGFPVDIRYEPDAADIPDASNQSEGQYVSRVLQKVNAIHNSPEEGDILAFLTSQVEVEWACRQNFNRSALVLPLHGKLQYEDQMRVFEEGPANVRRIIFATNLAETSLTIPGVRYVVDSGMAKDSYFDPDTGINVMVVDFIDQSAALQRAGRAGRTNAGICYRLYSKLQFEKMAAHRTPEILRVHLGVAMLKLLALGIKDPESFKFVEAPSPEAISLAIQSLHYLGAIDKQIDWKLTTSGFQLLKLGVEPRIGKILLNCIAKGYGREGVVLAALMSSVNTFFVRAGTEQEKEHYDRIKMRFCHEHGDLLTLLMAYKESESIPLKRRKSWCFENGINYKTLLKCQELIKELESCLEYELRIQISPCWEWSSASSSGNTDLQKVILSVLVENVAVFSGHLRFGYDVISSGQQALLHPSSAVLVYGNMPKWVVFMQLFCTSRNFLHCVTVIDPEWLREIPSFCHNIPSIEASILQRVAFPNLGAQLLKNICGKHNQKLAHLQKLIQQENRRCIIEPSYEANELRAFVSSDSLQSAKDVLEEVVQRERRWLHNQCCEVVLFQKVSDLDFPVILFGSGAMVKDIIMPGEFSSVEIFHPTPSLLDETETLVLFDKCGEGIGGFKKHNQTSKTGGKSSRWGTITLRSYISANLAVDWINGKEVGMGPLTVVPIKNQKQGIACKSFVDGVNARLTCLRRRSFGLALVHCEADEINDVVKSCDGKLVCGRIVDCFPDAFKPNSVCIRGLKPNVYLSDLENELRTMLQRPNLRVHIPRMRASIHPSNIEVQSALVNKISSYVPVGKFKVDVSPLISSNDFILKAFVKFDESQLEAAETAIRELHGAVLPNCQPWQSLRCQSNFSTSLNCSHLFFKVLREEFESVIVILKNEHSGVTFSEVTGAGGQRFQISAPSLSVAASCRASLEKLMEGETVSEGMHEQQLSILFSREGVGLAKRVEIQTRTYIAVDKRTRSVKVHGSKAQKAIAVEKLRSAIQQLYEKQKGREILLLGEELPQGLMREVVRQFGADLASLQDIAGVPVQMDRKRQSLYVDGETESVQKVQSALAALATSMKGSETKVVAQERDSDVNCAICLSPLEGRYSLEGCGHSFCRSCLVRQVSSLIHNQEGFPLACTYEGCEQRFLLADIEALVSKEQQEELQMASLSLFVAASRGSYKFCSTPDCPVVYRASSSGQLFVCPACLANLCTSCHVEYHEGLSCELYRTYRKDPDASLHAWRGDKDYVKNCPYCHYVIEKTQGCNHVTCKCGMHVCWNCLKYFGESADCYDHMRDIHGGFI